MMLSDTYLWLKGLHVAAAIVFVGGLLAETLFLAVLGEPTEMAPGMRQAVRVFRRWDSRLTTPAMLLAWSAGLTLALSAGWFHSGWLRVKVVLVLVLSALHGVQSGTLRRLAGSAGQARAQTTSVLVVVIGAACIALLAVAKPF